MDNINRNDFVAIIRRRRLIGRLSLRGLADASGISAAHLGRIERGERFPSAGILRKIAKPLGLDENELFVLAGYLSDGAPTKAESNGLDPYVAKVLAREPVETQRAVIKILTTVKSLAKSATKE